MLALFLKPPLQEVKRDLSAGGGDIFFFIAMMKLSSKIIDERYAWRAACSRLASAFGASFSNAMFR